MRVFFYGLFMDQRLLAAKGIRPTEVRPGYVRDYGLRIGERATLVRAPGNRAYGVLMNVSQNEAKELYAERSVSDYLPESVIVDLLDGTQADATCYNLPDDKVTGANREYAESLLTVATTLEFPDSYLDQIRRALKTN